jgi:hypothetical protein
LAAISYSLLFQLLHPGTELVVILGHGPLSGMDQDESEGQYQDDDTPCHALSFLI